MKILITGANGQVGQSFLRHAKNRCEIYAYDHQSLDITQQTAIEKILNTIKPDCVINAAAYTQVDHAEKEAELAFCVNADGAKNLALACASHHIPLIHISTDYVFSGEKTTPYLETDTTAPLNVYGASKLTGEKNVQTHHAQHIILRVSGVFSPFKINFVKKMLELGQTRTELNIIDDQFICPTAASDIAYALFQIASQLSPAFKDWGIYHYCSQEITSWFDFATTIFTQAKEYKSLALQTLKPISVKDYPTPAKRPRFSALDCEKIHQQFAITQPHWHTSLLPIISELLHDNLSS